MEFNVSRRIKERCPSCGFCEQHISCPGEEDCIGCGACVEACPYNAKFLSPVYENRKFVRVKVDGAIYEVPERITVLKALEYIGFKSSIIPKKDKIFAPCRTGGCWACAVIISGELKPSCNTPVTDGMIIQTDKEELSSYEPYRMVSNFQPHTVGGVGTPYSIKSRGLNKKNIEVVCFAHGCILRCSSCQNWEIVYSSKTKPISPIQAAEKMTLLRRKINVKRMAISGGECTLNRQWLINYLERLTTLNRDKNSRFHIDTNAVILTSDYIDDLVEAGMTDCGIDLKALKVETFKRITGVSSDKLAKRFLTTEWDAANYLIDRYSDKVFTGIGVVWNKYLIDLEEIERIGDQIVTLLGDHIQVTVLDYRSEFRRLNIGRPTVYEMRAIKKILNECGLKNVIIQTRLGNIGP
jgi:pyruvate formate lyase activating enzyme